MRLFQIKRFQSLPEAGGETLFFRAMGGDRRHPAPFFSPDEVPPFHGDTAWFLAERAPGRGWRIKGRVNAEGEPWNEPAEPQTGRQPGDARTADVRDTE